MEYFKSKIIKYLFILVLSGFLISLSGVASAFTTNTLFNGGSMGDFVLKSGRIVLEMDPGQSVTKEITLTNRLGKETTFIVEIEDLAGSKDVNVSNSYTLQGLNKGPFSLKDYIHPEVMEFTLKDGEQINLPVAVSIPADSRPGGLYGAIAFSAKDVTVESNVDGERVAIKPRLAYLFLVKVKGAVNEDGKLKEFSAGNKIYEKGPINFGYIIENNGNVHLNPYGTITIKNVIGTEIEKIKIEPFFTIPDSLRKNSVSFNRKFIFGKYTAEIKLNRGYLDKTDVVDTKTVTFWVIPWKISLAVLAGIIIIVWIISVILGKIKLSWRK